jgi:hypothetical protein
MLKAMDTFADSQTTAAHCMDVIRRFDPPSAAANIARGCATMLAG